jgi:hypothetical protein
MKDKKLPVGCAERGTCVAKRSESAMTITIMLMAMIYKIHDKRVWNEIEKFKILKINSFILLQKRARE